MTCATCLKWLHRKETKYSGGETVINWRDPDGKGLCQFLNAPTPSDFGCNYFQEGGPLIITATKEGEPWHHAVHIKCPDCTGNAGGCRRCFGSGLVLKYDDGYIGENGSKMHPKEKALGKRADAATPTCFNCRASVNPGWKMCPYCGTNLQSSNKSEVMDVL